MRIDSLSFFVYILRSRAERDRFYVGSTNSLEGRLRKHNQGGSPHTTKYAPWDMIWYSAFPTRSAAETFEDYLKSGSGRSFQKRHLAPELES